MSEQADVKFVSLLRTVVVELKSMLQFDVKLLRAEFGLKVAAVRMGGLWGLAALALTFLACLLLFEGLVLLLVWLGLAAYAACFVIAATLGASALVCGLKARAAVQALSLVPSSTIAAVQKDVVALKGAILNVEP